MLKSACLILLPAFIAASAVLAEPGSDPLQAAVNDETFKQITSVLVATDGKTTYERYFNGADANSMHDTRSAMKSLTAMAVGAAIDDGYLEGVETRAFSLFQDERPYRFSSPRKDAITLKDLLSMSSALDCNDDVWESPGNEEHMYPARSWTFFVVDMPTRQDYQRDETGFGPFSYCTAGSFFLGQVLERATDISVDKYIERRLLQPLGIRQINWDRSPSNEVQTGGGAELTSKDLLKLAELVRRGGKHDGQQLLSAGWIKTMLTAHVQPRPGQDYGYQWWRQDFACGDKQVSGWYMSGNGGNKVVVFDALDMSVVVTSTLYSTRGMHQQSTDLIENYILAPLPACQT